MSSKKLLGLGLLIAGIMLLYFGFNQAHSAMGEINQAISGKYSDETMAYLIGGAVAAVVGLFVTLKK